MRRVLLAALGLTLLSLTSTAKATLLTYESFNYGNSQNLSGKNGGSGWGGAWGVGLPSTGYMNETRNGTVAYTGHYVSPSPTSFSLSAGIGGGEGSDSATRLLNATYGATVGGGTGATVWGSITYTVPNVQPLVLSLRQGGTTNFSYALPKPAAAGTAQLAVFRMTPGLTELQDQLVLWVNPTLATFDPTTTTPTFSGTNVYQFNTLRFDLSNSGLGQNGNPNYSGTSIGEIRFGTTVGDVTIVPEPASISAAGGLLVLTLKRRKRA